MAALLASDRRAVIAELRRLTGAREPASPDALAPSGIAAVDEVLGGGWPRGRMVEIIGRRSSGRTSLGLGTLAAATRRGEVVALIDVDGMLDARSAEAQGIDLGRLLWVRSGDGARGIRAADLVLRADGFGVVVLDVGESAPRVPDAMWLRLGRAAERSHAALMVVSPLRAAGAFAAITVETSSPVPRLDGGGPSPRVLRAVESCVAVVRSKLGRPGGASQITFRRR